MPRTNDVDLYRHLLAQRADRAAGTETSAGTWVGTGTAPGPQTAVGTQTEGGPFAGVAAAMHDTDAILAAGERALVVRIVVPDEAAATSDALSKRHAVGAFVVLGDLGGACARRGVAGYARLLVRAGAAAQAGRAAATAAGYTVRLDEVAGRAPQPGESPHTPLCTLVLFGGDDD